jgi:very-short-patch-repair endonuclease
MAGRLRDREAAAHSARAVDGRRFELRPRSCPRSRQRCTDSELERCFLPIARRAGLSLPETGAYVNGFKVDFNWPELGLVVETDGLRYHRTPAQQTRDRIRDQAHVAAGLTPLRFTRAQVRFEPGYVKATLSATARHLCLDQADRD